jgi:hypothetical protein
MAESQPLRREKTEPQSSLYSRILVSVKQPFGRRAAAALAADCNAAPADSRRNFNALPLCNGHRGSYRSLPCIAMKAARAAAAPVAEANRVTKREIWSRRSRCEARAAVGG